ncbi:PadR family transcriptional regulator [Microbacterium sp.]|uniref:PadR family transcriptional regulator n=1 Tax=Microbacterium sp. TaxID=51671 RepID=UPI0025FBDF70|nr:PadR family transcriptional regulator [Microbacterium sp.]
MGTSFTDGRFGGKGFGGASADDLWNTLGQIKDGIGQGFGETFGQFGQFGRKVGTRAPRGDVRAAILSLLVEQPMHGYQLIQQIEERSGGAWKPSPGSVYPTLQMLTDEGLIEVEESGGRKTYSLTEAGRDEAADADRSWATAEPAVHTETPRAHRGGVVLSKSGANLAQAAMQVGRTGTPEQVAEAVSVLDDARRKLYAILARD